MGSVSMAIARAAQEAGATLVTNVEVMILPIILCCQIGKYLTTAYVILQTAPGEGGINVKSYHV